MRMKRERIDEYTERAISATQAGKLIPPIVYLPRRLRGKPIRLTEDNLRYTMDGPSVAENHVKIAGADPVGFLIAVMHGQPIPEFRIARDGAIDVYYTVPDFETRMKAAQFLAHKATVSKFTDNGYDARRKHEDMVAGALGRAALDDDNANVVETSDDNNA